ncbi:MULTISPECIES: CGNR zinc finger domain-containing protein [Streptomyces]|uniref:CGNR zinc finger domain-containing protein n=1 Tax=Streptomyces chilikensis TaxID=1194079 RepID=A0ABV3ESR0_9ACTN|nr:MULTISPECIES: CGNR zinc finger domain-containing protein [Streptomyces]MDH6224058.1 putative RNA-binding Zn ribbon-like protein [Streptomyces sp. MJP52]
MPPTPEADPRPLTDEPLGIDLLNTRWIDGTGRHDLLDSLDGLAAWLAGPLVSRALGGVPAPADHDTLRHLLQARAALDEAVADPRHPDAGAVEALNAVLAHGRRGLLLRPDGPDTYVEVEDPSWLPAWRAAEDYLRLLAERPERIRACGNPECILHFYDVSKNGTRRWCSMAGCGNRAKAQRHYARQRKA